MVLARLMTAGLLFTAAVTNGQSRRPPEIRALVDLALSAPPELAADALIRLAESPAIPDKPWKMEILDQAYSLAGSAKHPYLRAAAAGRAMNTDSDAGILNMALEAPRLSALDLQVRATRAMLPLNSARALDMFERIPPLRFPALTCRDSMRYGVDGYYVLVRDIFDRGYSPEERRKGAHLAMMRAQLASITSPVQFIPVARLIAPYTGEVQGDLKVENEIRREWIGVLASIMKRLVADDRTFSSASGVDLLHAVSNLVSLCQRRGIPAAGLVEAYRSYLIRHFTAARCADSRPPVANGETIGGVVNLLNKALLPDAAPHGEIAPLQPEDLKPAKTEGTAEVYDSGATQKHEI